MRSTQADPRRTFHILLAAAVILNILDMILTLYWSAQYGPAIEANPLMARLLTRPALFVALKLALPAIYVPVSIVAARKHFRTAFLGAVVVVAFYCLILAWNAVDCVRTAMMLRGIG